MMRKLTLGVLALTACAAIPAQAGADIGAAAMVTPPPSFSEPAATVRDNRKPGGNTLRCWQEGRLLYEGSGFRMPPGAGQAAIAVPRQSDSDGVVLFDLKHGLCILTGH